MTRAPERGSVVEEVGRAICGALYDGGCGMDHSRETMMGQAAEAACKVIAARLREALDAELLATSTRSMTEYNLLSHGWRAAERLIARVLEVKP